MNQMILAMVMLSLIVPAMSSAQQPAAQRADPDRQVAGSGQMPAGWQVRLDSPNAKRDQLKFVARGTGFHATTGPAGIFYDPSTSAQGSYQVQASFTQTKPSAHPEAYGLLIGGADLQGPGQRYTYFLIRQDGKYLIKRRAGAETKTVVDWTDSAAIKKAGADGAMTNTLSIAVAGDRVRFLVNGQEVTTQARAGLDTDGIAGLRVNHNLDVSIEAFGLKTGSTN